MKSWQLAWRHGIQAGGVASVQSAAALALASSREAGSPFACLNATSHWLWGDEAARHQAASLRYTGTGYQRLLAQQPGHVGEPERLRQEVEVVHAGASCLDAGRLKPGGKNDVDAGD